MIHPCSLSPAKRSLSRPTPLAGRTRRLAHPVGTGAGSRQKLRTSWEQTGTFYRLHMLIGNKGEWDIPFDGPYMGLLKAETQLMGENPHRGVRASIGVRSYPGWQGELTG